MAIPRRDSLLVPYCQNWDTRVTASPSTFSLTAGQATVLHGYVQAYLDAYNAEQASVAADTRSKSLTTAKNTAKASLLLNLRELYTFVQASTSVSDANKNLLGVTVKKTTPTPTPPPGVAPAIQCVSANGLTVKLRFSDSDMPSRRGLPPGSIGINVFSFVGATPPAGPDGWRFQGGTGKLFTDVTFDPSLAPGTKVWFTAFFFNRRKESGPAATPISTNLPGGAALPIAAAA